MLGNKPPNDASKHRWKIAVAVFSGILSLACVRLRSLYFLFKFIVTIFGVITEKKNQESIVIWSHKHKHTFSRGRMVCRSLMVNTAVPV